MKLLNFKPFLLIITLFVFQTTFSQKVENKLTNELDYTKEPLKLYFRQLNGDEIPFGEISKKGKITFYKPKFNIKEIYKQANYGTVSLSSMLDFSDCDEDFSSDNNVYSYKYDIFIKKYQINAAGLIPLSNQKVLEYHNDKVQLGSKYHWFYIDRDTNIVKTCTVPKYEKEITKIIKLNLKKGWNLIKNEINEKQTYSFSGFNGEIPKKIIISTANPKDKNIKWIIKQYASDKELELNKKYMQLEPYSQEKMTKRVPIKISDLNLITKEYCKEIKQINNKNNAHLVYQNKDNTKQIEIFLIDAAKDPETIMQVDMVYDMEKQFGKSQNKPYVAKYDDANNTSDLLYKINDRLILKAKSKNLKPDELWKYITELKLNRHFN